MEEVAEGRGGTSGHAIWTSAMSALMLSHLNDLVAASLKISKGFKKHIFNGCTRTINEKLNTRITGEQVKNHLKTWQKRKNCMITLDEEHYNGHVHNHKSNAEFLNKPLLRYREMEAIFGNNMATGNFAKDSGAPLGREDDEGESQEEEDNVIDHDLSDGPTSQEVISSASRLSKKAKVAEMKKDVLVTAFKSVGENLVAAIKLVAQPDNELPADLFDTLNQLLGFNSAHISFYYAHLVTNLHIGKVFYKLLFDHKLNWVTMFIAEKFSGM
uniref:Myb/SANT-like domain-containing protein n=1 Tax=Setaria viridis TaxID=4556 RepID=A0A4U6VD29_SETVI|nr:hypothetical protein SEVIR_3G171400v2 [Setaria viridis]